MSIATDMATEWLASVAAPGPADPGRRYGRRAELLGAGTHIVGQLLAEIEDLRAQLAEAQQ